MEEKDMIYTLTLNPSLDYIVTVPDFKLGQVNRTNKEIMFPGGKGINVSIVLNNLGMQSTILGFAAGFTGEEIRRRVKEMGCEEDLITVNHGHSRINLKLRSNEESEINGMGPLIDEKSLEQMYQKLNSLKKGDVLVLSGSIPASMPDTTYSDILKIMNKKEVMVTVDATKELLLNALEHHPFLIKPNNHELEEIFEVTLNDKKAIMKYAKKLQEKGARNVLVSMAGDGAILVTEDGKIYESAAPKGTVVNSVGAGDSMVAGFLYGYLMYDHYETAFRMGVAAGSASAFSERLATKDEVEEILQLL